MRDLTECQICKEAGYYDIVIPSPIAYSVNLLKLTRTFIDTEPKELSRFGSLKKAQGAAKAAAHSQFEVMLKHMGQDVINYYDDYTDYHIFIVEDTEGIVYEAHIFVKEIYE